MKDEPNNYVNISIEVYLRLILFYFDLKTESQ